MTLDQDDLKVIRFLIKEAIRVAVGDLPNNVLHEILTKQKLLEVQLRDVQTKLTSIERNFKYIGG